MTSDIYGVKMWSFWFFACTDKRSRNALESAFGSVLPDMFMRNPAKIYLFKVTIQTLEKGVKYVQS